ncbi:hypothetical protein D3C77_86290 [compost metagenome]
MDLRQPGEFTDDLFAHSQPVTADKVMTILDEIKTVGKRVFFGWPACRRRLIWVS